MTDTHSYSRTKYYCSIIVSAINPKRCGIHVDTKKPSGVLLSKPNDTDFHVIHRTYSYDVPKKAAYTSLICNLRDTGIIPVTGIIQNINPDNKFYVNIPSEQYRMIVSVVELTLNGLCLGPDLRPRWEVEEVGEKERELAAEMARGKIIDVTKPTVVIINPGQNFPYDIHSFLTKPPTPKLGRKKY